MRKITDTLLLALLIGALPVAGLARAAEGATPWLGVYMQTVDDQLREAMDLTGDGALVSRVVSGSPAEAADVRKGDIIRRFAGSAVGSSEGLSRLVANARVGQTVTLQVLRGKDALTLTARLDARPTGMDAPEAPSMSDEGDDSERRIIVHEEKGPAPGERRIVVRAKGDATPGEKEFVWDGKGGEGQKRIIVRTLPGDDDAKDTKRRVRIIRRGGSGEDMDIEIPDLSELKGLHDMSQLRALRGLAGGRAPHMMMMGLGRGRLGVQVQDLNEQLGEYFQVPGGRGALVMEVVKDAPAERVGLRAGDVITQVGDQPVEGASDLVEALQGKEGRVTVTIVRKGQTQTLEPELAPTAPRHMRMESGDDRLAPEPPSAPGRDDLGDLRDQMRELREQLRQLRDELKSTQGGK